MAWHPRRKRHRTLYQPLLRVTCDSEGERDVYAKSLPLELHFTESRIEIVLILSTD